MATKTFHLEIRVSTNDERNFDTVKEIMKKTARDLYAITSVAKGDGGSKPVIELYAEDWVAGKEILNPNENTRPTTDSDIAEQLAAAEKEMDEMSIGDEVL